MRELWLATDEIVCVHPLWPALHGEAAVLASWQRICANGPSMRVAYEVLSQNTLADQAVHLVREHLYHSDGSSAEPVVATNLYRVTNHGWRIALHHASPEPGVATHRPAGPIH